MSKKRKLKKCWNCECESRELDEHGTCGCFETMTLLEENHNPGLERNRGAKLLSLGGFWDNDKSPKKNDEK